jgi:hypothetical protein
MEYPATSLDTRLGADGRYMAYEHDHCNDQMRADRSHRYQAGTRASFIS